MHTFTSGIQLLATGILGLRKACTGGSTPRSDPSQSPLGGLDMTIYDDREEKSVVFVAKRTDRDDGLTELTFQVGNIIKSIRLARLANRPLNQFEDVGSLAEATLVLSVSAGIRHRFPRTFLLTNEQTEIAGKRYGTSPRVFGPEELIRNYPHLGIPVEYDKLGNFRTGPEVNSLLVDLNSSELVTLLPLVVGDMMMPVTYAFIFLPTNWTSDRVRTVAAEVSNRGMFERALLAEGGGIYFWFEEPYFEFIIPTGLVTEVITALDRDYPPHVRQ